MTVGARVPIVMVPGASQTGAVFESTPDGRAGWAPLLRDSGYPVYVIDPPASGRCGRDGHGPLSHYSRFAVERFFTAPSAYRLWPGADAHTRWPGGGRRGDPVFERFYRSTVGYLPNLGLAERLTSDAVVAVLDRVGAAVLLTHSQAGPAGWSSACRRPSLVRAVVAVEPTGPPFYDVGLGKDPAGRPGDVVRPHGITIDPLPSEPPPGDPAGVRRVTRTIGGLRVPYGVLDGPPRTLPGLAGVPVLVVTGESSYHAHYDELTVEYLRGRGVPVEHLRLDEIGIRGNGHLMMLESNSDEIAREIVSWVGEQSEREW